MTCVPIHEPPLERVSLTPAWLAGASEQSDPREDLSLDLERELSALLAALSWSSWEASSLSMLFFSHSRMVCSCCCAVANDWYGV